MTNDRAYRMAFSNVYPLLVQKAELKGRTKSEVDTGKQVDGSKPLKKSLFLENKGLKLALLH